MSGSIGPRLRLADIDRRALARWSDTWTGSHPSGAGGWNWPDLVALQPRRAALLPLAIWYGPDLCGLALGHASRPGSGGVRHTVTLTYVERRPEPPSVPLRGKVVPLAVAVARSYGLALGAKRLRLRYPDPNLLQYYQLLGFDVAWKGEKTGILRTGDMTMKKSIHTVQPPKRKKASGFIDRFARFARREAPLPTQEEARRRIRSRPGFFASLSPEARAAVLEYDGPEAMGPPPDERRP
ncbi:MAG TPA: hypothetical protein VF746_31985 [Longimicrobium sp.]